MGHLHDACSSFHTKRQLIDGKIWIQYDCTEEGVATELLETGVLKAHIVLGFRHPSERKYTGLAVAVSYQPQFIYKKGVDDLRKTILRLLKQTLPDAHYAELKGFIWFAAIIGI